jgi:nucleoside-diphosphate-sugar epimerase
MKILIVGGTSSIAQALIPVLSNFSEVITGGRKNCDLELNLSEVNSPIVLPKDVDVIIHTAAHFGGKTPEEIVGAEAVNVLGTLRLCQAAVEANIKHFIFISSIYSLMHPDSGYYSVYALSKKHAEEAARFFCLQCGLPLTILRPAQLYGNSDKFRKHQPFLYMLADKAANGDDIDLYGKNDARRNFLHINDLTIIILKVIQMKIVGVYSCSNPVNTSLSEIARSAILAFNSKSKINVLVDKDDVKDNVFPIDDTLYTIIGFYPEIGIEEGMKMIAKSRTVRS